MLAANSDANLFLREKRYFVVAAYKLVLERKTLFHGSEQCFSLKNKSTSAAEIID
jgi:hypothetical protein